MFFFFHYSNILIQGMALQILPIVWIWAFWYNKAPTIISSAAQCDAGAAVGIILTSPRWCWGIFRSSHIGTFYNSLFLSYRVCYLNTTFKIAYPVWQSETVVVGTYVWASKNSSTPPRRSKHNTDSRNSVAFSRWRNYSRGLIVRKTYF